MKHFSEPRHFGRMEGAHLVGVAGVPGQGRFLVVYLSVSTVERPESRTGEQQEAGEQRVGAGGRIVEAMFHCHGCGATIACGSMLTEMITGKLIEESRDLTPGNLIEALDGLPPDKKHCAGLALQALSNGINHETQMGPHGQSATGE